MTIVLQGNHATDHWNDQLEVEVLDFIFEDGERPTRHDSGEGPGVYVTPKDLMLTGIHSEVPLPQCLFDLYEDEIHHLVLEEKIDELKKDLRDLRL